MTLGQLDTANPGNIGLLVDENTVALWTFAEVQEVPCSDLVGTVDDLAADTVDAPSVVSDGAWAQSVARNFTDGGLVAGDQAGAAQTTALTRDLTIQAILSLPLDGTNHATIVVRGLGGSSAERVPFALELYLPGGGSPTLRLVWEDSAGVETADTGAPITLPPLGTEVQLVTATRRWESTDRVVCRYYLGDTMIGESTLTAAGCGAIGGATTGHLSIGCRKVAGVFDRRWATSIDELKITRHEMPAEEITATWRRLTGHQPAGVELVQAMPAPGTPISGNPASRIQRLLRFAGQALGGAAARAEQLGDLLPDRAYGDVLERWEAIAGLPSLGLASVDARRDRLIAHLRRKGWNLTNLADAVAVLLDCDAADLEVDNFSNTFTDAFASVRAERWQADPGASTVGWSVTGGALRIQCGATNDVTWSGPVRKGPTCTMPIESATGLYHAAHVDLTTFPTDGEVGLYLRHGSNGDHVFFGVVNAGGGDLDVVLERFRGGASLGSTTLATIHAAEVWLRVEQLNSGGFLGTVNDAPWTFSWSDDGATYDTEADVTWARRAFAIGFYCRSLDPSLSGALDVRFDEWLARTPQGSRPFNVYVFRDLGLGGTPDVLGASAVLKRFRHAYVHSAAITSRSLLCDDTGSGCDLGPLGGF